MKTKKDECDKFTSLLGRLLKVPHSETKAKLDAEKLAKKRRKASKRLPQK